MTDSPARPPKAGARFIRFATSPMGEEVLEGALGGAMVVAPQFFSEEDPRENALQLALAMGGGIGLGMAGRRIGAAIGERLHKGEIKNESIASLVRAFGQETMGEGLSQSLSHGAHLAMQRDRSNAAYRLEKDLRSMDDQTFAETYPDLATNGLLPSTTTKEDLNRLGAYRDALEQATGKERDLREVESLEELGDIRAKSETVGALVEGAGFNEESLHNIVQGAEQPVTGKHAGRLAGRIFGDEVGILGGMALGGYIANNVFGWQSAKDAEIARLKEQLGNA